MLKKIYLLLLSTIFLIGVGVAAFFGIIHYFRSTLPQITSLNDYKPSMASQILSKDGEVLVEIGNEKRDIAKMEEIPPTVINSFLAAEDGNFFQHEGVDYPGVFRAMLANLRAGKIVQGGSTITQQVAKSLLLTSERSFTRKIKDFLLAQRIEKFFSKEEILFLYLNQVYLGGGFYGVKTAFNGYFGKTLSEATVPETALVAGLLVAPGRYSPNVNPSFAKNRQKYVLKRLMETGKIDAKAHEAAVNEKIKILIRNSELKAPYFTEWIRQKAVDILGNDEFLNGGYKIVTTLDSKLQKVAEQELINGVGAIDKRQGFKGPIASLSVGDNEISNFEKNYRKDLYKKNSKYFYLLPNGEVEYEYGFNEEEYEKLKKSYADRRSAKFTDPYELGYLNNDQAVKMLNTNDLYKAIVINVLDQAKIIQVSIAGVSGFIPYEGFSWAHKRQISETTANYQVLEKPSSALKKGDIVWVSLSSTNPANLWTYIDKNFKKSIKSESLIKTLKEENYVLCKLDQEPDIEGALVSLEANSGNIISFVGGKNFDKSKFNRVVQSLRQPGSSYKPIIYAAALESGMTPADIIYDTPEALTGYDDSLKWKPKNYDNEFLGPVTFRKALETSRNVPTIKISDKVGVQNILKFSKRVGIKSEISPDLSLALGTFGISLLNLTKTYAIFPNGGKRIIPKAIDSIVNREGEKIKFDEAKSERLDNEQSESKEQEKTDSANTPIAADESNRSILSSYLSGLSDEQVFDKRLAYIMTNLLRGVVQNGTGQEARSLGAYVGGKTGTTNDYVDAWFVGFNHNVVTGVWTGFDQNITMGYGETGAKAALPIWIKFMKPVMDQFGDVEFRVPAGIVNAYVTKEGTLSEDSQSGYLEAFVEGTEPGNTTKKEQPSGNINPTPNAQILEDDYYNAE